MEYYRDSHDIRDIGDHPLLPDDPEINLLHALLQIDCNDASNRCQDAVLSHGTMITANHTYFSHIKNVWTGIRDSWSDIKTFFKQIKKNNITNETFKLWLPQYLYQNNIINVTLTNGNQLGYKQLRRYIMVEDEAYDLWNLYTISNLVLPCDSLNGPFISNNNQIYRCQELLNLIRREQRGKWDDNLSLIENFRRNTDWVYWYGDMLPFYNIWSNSYDRRRYFEENANERGQRNLASRNDGKISKKFKTRKEFMFQSKIEALEKELDQAKAEIQRKEQVIQDWMQNYSNLQQRFAQLQLQQQHPPNHQPFGYYYFNVFPQQY